MSATTEQKARMFDLTAGVMELVRDGNRDIAEVLAVFQIIKDDANFAGRLLANNGVNAFAPQSLLLEPIGRITIPATTKPFAARGKFVLNYGRKATAGALIS